MKVWHLIQSKSTDTSFQSDVAYPQTATPDTGILFVQTSVNPTAAAKHIDVRLQGRPTSNANWRELAQFDENDTYENPTGTIFVKADVTVPVMPEMRIEVVSTSEHVNTINAWLAV